MGLAHFWWRQQSGSARRPCRWFPFAVIPLSVLNTTNRTNRTNMTVFFHQTHSSHLAFSYPPFLFLPFVFLFASAAVSKIAFVVLVFLVLPIFHRVRIFWEYEIDFKSIWFELCRLRFLFWKKTRSNVSGKVKFVLENVKCKDAWKWRG